MEPTLIPLLNPKSPGTMRPENLTILRRRGFYAASADSIAVFTSREDWGRQNRTTFPEEGDTPKLWQDAALAREFQSDPALAFKYLYVSDRRIAVENSPTSPGFSDPSFEVYSGTAANTYREHADFVMHLGGVPAVEYRSVTHAEAVRLNLSAGTSVDIPIVTLPTEYLLVPIPDTGDVGAMHIQDFQRWAREWKSRKNATVSAPAPPPAAAQPQQKPPVAPTPPVSMVHAAPIEYHEGLGINTATGEAICNDLPTGWHFGLPTQQLPIPGGDLDSQFGIYRVSPWAYATPATAERILSMMRAAAPDLQLQIVAGDANARFPASSAQLYIGVVGVPSARVNAGLVASYCARMTFYDAANRRIVQATEPHIREAVESLRTEVVRQS